MPPAMLSPWVLALGRLGSYNADISVVDLRERERVRVRVCVCVCVCVCARACVCDVTLTALGLSCLVCTN